jgi:hypothetical protein
VRYALLAVIGMLATFAFPILQGFAKRRFGQLSGAGIIVVLAVPYWIGVSKGNLFVPAALFVTWLLLALGVSGIRHLRARESLLLFALLASALCAVVFERSAVGDWFDLTLVWGGCFLLGLALSSRVGVADASRFVAVVGALLGSWALLEFILDWHPFVALIRAGGPYNVWAPVQSRSGHVRSEAAMGHAIALGNVIALCVPFALSARMGGVRKLAVLTLCFAGVVVTYSRASLITAVIGLVLSVVVLRLGGLSRTTRQLTLVAAALAAVLLLPTYFASMSSTETQAEVSASSEYRANYVSLLSGIRWLGPAANRVLLDNGHFGYASADYHGGVVRSVDNSILLVGLQFGWLALAIFVALLASLAMRIMQSRTNPAMVAVIAQTFAVCTVAMITQFAYAYWITVGLAVGWSMLSARDGDIGESERVGTRWAAAGVPSRLLPNGGRNGAKRYWSEDHILRVRSDRQP